MRRVLVLVTTSILLLGGIRSIDAQVTGPADSGWWFQPTRLLVPGLDIASPIPASPPDTQPGELVAAVEDGEAVAVAAIRYVLPDGSRAISLGLHVVRSTGAGSVVACVSGTPWKGDEAGDWSAKPVSDCSAGSIAGTATPDGMTFDVTGLQVGSSLDIVLLPDANTAMEIVFSPPATEALTVRGSERAAVDAPAFEPSGGGQGVAPQPMPIGPTADSIVPPLTSRDQPSDVAAPSQGIDVLPTADPLAPTSDTTGRLVATLVASASLGYWFLTRSGRRRPTGTGLAGFTAPRDGRPVALR